MLRHRSFRNSFPIILLFLSFFTHCGTLQDVITSEIEVVSITGDAWNDFMPGSPPKFISVLQIALRNTTTKDIVLHGASGAIIDDRSGNPLRKFRAIILYEDVEMKEVRLPPDRTVSLTARTPEAVLPIDPVLYGSVRFMIEGKTSLEKSLILRSSPMELFETQ